MATNSPCVDTLQKWLHILRGTVLQKEERRVRGETGALRPARAFRHHSVWLLELQRPRFLPAVPETQLS